MNSSTLKVWLLIAASVAVTLACGQASGIEVEPAGPSTLHTGERDRGWLLHSICREAGGPG